jgi:uncharacterized membrane protein
MLCGGWEYKGMGFNPLKAELNPTRHLLSLAGAHHFVDVSRIRVNPLNAELNPIRHLLALAGAHHFVHVSRMRVKKAAVPTMKATTIVICQIMQCVVI